MHTKTLTATLKTRVKLIKLAVRTTYEKPMNFSFKAGVARSVQYAVVRAKNI